MNGRGFDVPPDLLSIGRFLNWIWNNVGFFWEVAFGSNFEKQFGNNYGEQVLTNDCFEEDNFG